MKSAALLSWASPARPAGLMLYSPRKDAPATFGNVRRFNLIVQVAYPWYVSVIRVVALFVPMLGTGESEALWPGSAQPVMEFRE